MHLLNDIHKMLTTNQNCHIQYVYCEPNKCVYLMTKNYEDLQLGFCV